MNKYTLFYYPTVANRLAKLQPSTRKKVISLFTLLQKDPLNKGFQPQKISNKSSTYRIHVGNIKILYEVQRNKRIFIWNLEIGSKR